MSTTHVMSAAHADAAGAEFQYRPLSSSAVASLALGLLSTMIFVAARVDFSDALFLSPLALVGLFVGVRALLVMRAAPDQYSGGKFAVLGVVISAISLFGGLGFAGWVRATEVPDGYAPTSFAEMAPDEVERRADRVIPEDVAALDGKKVFIKGYMRPDSTPFRVNIDKFLLVRDNNQCCFGDLSSVNYFDQMAVQLVDGKRLEYHGGLYRMGGTLRIVPENARTMSGPTYYLVADYAE